MIASFGTSTLMVRVDVPFSAIISRPPPLMIAISAPKTALSAGNEAKTAIMSGGALVGTGGPRYQTGGDHELGHVVVMGRHEQAGGRPGHLTRTRGHRDQLKWGVTRTGAADKIAVLVKYGSLSERNLTKTAIFGLDGAPWSSILPA
jgi:hypothetical protein